MRVLIVKMSSMGDIIHTLPAITDASKALPNIQFDWVVEEAFTEIPTWHEHVRQVVPIALRRWRTQAWNALRQGEIKRFTKQLRSGRYDKIIDAQGSIKSSVVTRLARGDRLGMDRNSVREHLANLAYQKRFSVSRKQHAINRLRQLFSKALDYPLPVGPPRYGIAQHRLQIEKSCLPSSSEYLVLVPSASRSIKRWPEASWVLLLKKITQARIPAVISWGNEEEREYAVRICRDEQGVTLLPALSLSEMANVFLHAKATICVDTGLSHLAAALEIPTITLYGPTDPKLIGTMGPSQTHLQMVNNQLIPVEAVWQKLREILSI